jgi:hypothetical protein
MVRAFFLLFVPSAVLTACHECSTESCTDHASVTLNPNGGIWVDGDYSLEVEFDDAAYSCTFTMPDDAPDETGTRKAIDCTPTLEAFLAPFVRCDQNNGMSSIDDCNPQPVPSKYYLEVLSPGTPNKVHVVLTRGAEIVSDYTRDNLYYVTVQPNGPECAPTCRQAEVGSSF